MALVLTIAGIYLVLIGVLNLKKSQLYSLLAALACCVFSIELIANLDGLTIGFLTALTIASLPSIKVNFYDIMGCLIIALPCIFWLNTQEFTDGFAYSHIIVALGVAGVGYLIFDKRKRQTLCALVLLTSYIICYLSKVYFNLIDIVLSFLITIVFAENFKNNARSVSL